MVWVNSSPKAKPMSHSFSSGQSATRILCSNQSVTQSIWARYHSPQTSSQDFREVCPHAADNALALHIPGVKPRTAGSTPLCHPPSQPLQPPPAPTPPHPPPLHAHSPAFRLLVGVAPQAQAPPRLPQLIEVLPRAFEGRDPLQRRLRTNGTRTSGRRGGNEPKEPGTQRNAFD